MLEVVFALVGSMTGVCGLSISYAGYRLQRREARAREAERLAREAERRQAQDRDERIERASRFSVGVSVRRSRLHDEEQPQLRVHNYTGGPVTQLVVHCGPDQQVALPDIPATAEGFAASTHEFDLPAAAFSTGRPDVVVDFTDSSGRRWRRSWNGTLLEGCPEPDGTITWRLGLPAIHTSGDNNRLSTRDIDDPRRASRARPVVRPADGAMHTGRGSQYVDLPLPRGRVRGLSSVLADLRYRPGTVLVTAGAILVGGWLPAILSLL